MNTRVAAIIINNRSEVLLIHRIKNGVEYFVLPGGGIEDGENEIDAIKREIKEETSLDIKLSKIILEIKNNKFNRNEIYYLVKSFTGNPRLGGPELDRQSENNFYKLEWIKVVELQNYNLLPSEAIKTIQNLINNQE